MSEHRLGPLPAGRHGLSPETVRASQRERLLGACAEATLREGYASVAIGDIISGASVSRRAFYEHFKDKDACFAALLEVIVGHIEELVAGAIEPIEDWPERVVVAGRTLLDFFDAEPDLARLCLVEARAAGPAVSARLEGRLFEQGAAVLRAGRTLRSSARPLPDSLEGSLLGAMTSKLSRSVAAGDERLGDLLPDLIEIVLTPYLGQAEAVAMAATVEVSNTPRNPS